jgi:hypothetical protein
MNVLTELGLEVDWNGDGLLFLSRLTSEVGKRSLEDKTTKIPNFKLWYDRRLDHHRELRKLCDNERKRTLAERLILFYCRQDAVEDERTTGGGSNEYRSWRRVERPELVKTIEGLAENSEELWEIATAVRKAMPEQFVIYWRGEPEQELERLNNFYAKVLNSGYHIYWDFTLEPPAVKEVSRE